MLECGAAQDSMRVRLYSGPACLNERHSAMMSPLAGRWALVTGSTQGLGLAIATELAAAGCNVALAGLTSMPMPRVSGTRSRAPTACGRSIATRTCAGRTEVARMVADTTAAFGSIDILVNNAVVRPRGPRRGRRRPDAWDESLAVNLSAAFHAIRLAMPGDEAEQLGPDGERVVRVPACAAPPDASVTSRPRRR